MSFYQQNNSYKDYLKSVENKIYESKFIAEGGIPYYAYGIRLINNTNTGGVLGEDCMACISMNHTKLYDINNINNVILNLVPMSKLLSGEFILMDYKYPDTDESITIQGSGSSPYITSQFVNRPIKQVKSFRDVNTTIKTNINREYTDLTFNKFNVIRFEQFKEVYSRDVQNKQLIVFTSIEHAFAGIHSFTKIIEFDINTKMYTYFTYQHQNRLENINGFSIEDYNQQVLNIFGSDNLLWKA